MVFNTNLANHEYFQFVLTHECNRTCKFCIDYRRGDDAYMSQESFSRGLVHAKEAGVKQVQLIGGEPTLHPNFVAFAQEAKAAGFEIIVTTNFDNPEPIYEALPWVDSWNFSYYGQKSIPLLEGVDITLSALIYGKGFLNTQEKLDKFIDRYQEDYTLKFSTLSIINDYTAKHADPGPWIDELPGERMVLFDFIMAQTYRGHLIKRYDVEGPELYTLDSWKCLVDGSITRDWTHYTKPAVAGLGELTLKDVSSQAS